MELQEIIEKTGDLPSLPMVAVRINEEMASESLNAKALGQILNEDSSLAAKILRLSNSAFYGMPRQVTSIEKAVMILGFNAVKNLALGVSVYSFFKGEEGCTIDVQGLWNHSLGVAVAARSIMAHSDKRLADEAFLLGIIHDLGKVVMINGNLPEMEKVVSLMREKEICQAEAEREIFGFGHQRAGAALMRHWNFNDSMILGVKVHHNIPPDVKKMDQDTGQLARALCVANQMAKALGLGKSTNSKREVIPPLLWKLLAIKREDLPELGREIKEDYQAILAAWESGDR